MKFGKSKSLIFVVILNVESFEIFCDLYFFLVKKLGVLEYVISKLVIVELESVDEII